MKVFRVKKNKPQLVATESDTFTDEFQLVMQAMKAAKLLPAAAFARNQFGGDKYCHAYLLRDAGFADVIRI